MGREFVTIINTVPPDDLREALTQAAREADVTVNDVAVLVIARYFGEAEDLSGKPFQTSTARKLKVSVPEHLYQRLRLEAAEQLGTLRGVTLGILARELKTEPIDIGRRPRGGKGDDLRDPEEESAVQPGGQDNPG